MTNTPPANPTEEQVHALLEKIPRLRQEIGKVIIGQQAVVEELLTAFLAGGHCLLEGLPGLGKTLLIRTLAQAVDLVFHRIQFTPDLMPSDIIGTEVLEEDHATGKRFFQFNKGPLFGQIVLADEINRTPPKTQSALLEAMQEGSVTYGGKTYDPGAPVFRPGHAEPHRTGRHLSAARGAARPFFALLANRLSHGSGRVQDAGADHRQHRRRSVTPRHDRGGCASTCRRWPARWPSATTWWHYVARLVRATRDKSLPYIEKWVRWGAGPRAGQALITGRESPRAVARWSLSP